MACDFSRRDLLRTGAAAAAAGLAAPTVISSAVRAQNRTLYVNTYGGDLERAWKAAFCEPFTKATGIQVRTVTPVSFAKLRAQVETKNYEWDITCMNTTQYEQAEHEGLTEKINLEIVKDVPKSIIRENSVGGYVLGTLLVYRKDKFPSGGPTNWADFWDVKKFPGNRCLMNRSFTCLAWALLADGVPKDKLYPMDLDRAFKKLDEIKPHIKVWWTQGAQSQQLLQDREVDLIGLWSSRAATLVERGEPLEMVWNGAENFTTVWFVPKGAPKADIAWQFANFVGQAQQQAAFTKALPYGPANLDAVKMVPEARMRLTPSWPGNLNVSFEHDEAWLAPRLSRINERWTQWLAS